MRKYLIDSFAALSFFTVFATLSELLVAGMDWHQVFLARLMAIPAMLLTSRPYGLWRDWIFARCNADQRSILARIFIDMIAFMSFQIPVYVAILVFAGANLDQIFAAASSAVAFMLILSRPFGLYLEACRRVFNKA
ncbi:MAG: L-alanine exporter AlaE [Hyphomicrobiales bacterium]|nr:L-alanine exporter AlaE [Hyphomicrobiales bacterium]PCJ89459.1 MAG: L-alanine exporter AlaE [Hyphomicrobiales bacterium]